jgi:dihydroorotate dehydrogenase (NAD+) catalytic subunit
MTVDFCGLRLAHPVLNGSGTFDVIAAERVFGEALLEHFPFSAYVSKTITRSPRDGNLPPRLWEAPAGLINSIGLPNKGLHAYLAEDLPRMHELLCRARPAGAGARLGAGVPLITNVMGASVQELAELIAACSERTEIAAVELNVSCPNVATGLDIGADPDTLGGVVDALRALTAKPMIVKLTPNTADVASCAIACERAGADAVSLINTLRATALAPRRAVAAGPGTRWLGGSSGGLSGPAIRSVALAQVAAVAAAVSLPVVGMGGVQTAGHARELLDIGATLVAVGTESFRDPGAGGRIAEALSADGAPAATLIPAASQTAERLQRVRGGGVAAGQGKG